MVDSRRWRTLVATCLDSLDDLTRPWRHESSLLLAGGPTAVAQTISQRQLHLMIEKSRGNIILNAVAIVLCAYGLWTLTASSMTLWWTCAIVVSFAGCVHAIETFDAQSTDPQDWRKLEVRLGRWICIDSACWGSVGFFFPESAPQLASYIAMALLLVTVGGLTMASTYRPGIAWNALPCMALAGGHLLSLGDTMTTLTGIGFMLTILLAVQWALVHNRLLTKTLMDSEEKRALLQTVEREKQEAQRAHQVKSQFLAAVSHDLRQPMSSVSLLSGALILDAKADPQLLRQLDACVDSMQDMMSTLLHMAKLEIDALPLNIQTVNLQQLCRNLSSRFEAQARAKGLHFIVPSTSLRVQSDSYHLQRAMENLVSNALKYTDSGKVRVRFKVRADWVWLQVWDTGCGIAPFERQRIFEDFVQLHRSSGSGASSGMGLGLGLVRRVVELLGHRIILRSKLGKGSMFAIGVKVQNQPQLP